ncbi:hypothetical protein N9230_00430 [Akkermansiaceae bacterium]|nr:hypothetical protein [Akkermansiaceae bacterium]
MRHHYALDNPCNRLEKIQSNLEDIGVLPLAEVKRLLYSAIHYQEGSAVAPLAIALFAGLRPSEISDLKASDIGQEKIRISGGKLRRKLKRTAPIVPNLARWLKAFPFNGIPPGWRYKVNKLREIAKTDSWCHDVLRHTSITFQAERDKNEALTAFNCGTSKRMMDQHYRDVLDNDDEVEEFWNLTPTIVESENISVTLPMRRKTNWPSASTLKKLVWEKPLIYIAQDLGVSNVSVKKHCVKLGINLPPRGHWLK